MTRRGTPGKQSHRQPSPRITWGLCLSIPLMAAVVTWLLMEATRSADGCGGGAPPPTTALDVAIGILVLTGPIAAGWYARHGRPLIRRIIAPVLLSLASAVVLIFVAGQVWWIGHGCYL
jgi:hypothetical protein